MLLPSGRLLPWIVRTAIVSESVTDPRVVLPAVKVTVPVGEGPAPFGGLTTATSVALSEGAMLPELAETVVVVAAVTASVVEPVELAKFPVGE